MSGLVIICPACGSDKIVTTRDIMFNLDIIQCAKCRETYAIRLEDLYKFGIEQVIREWHESYTKTKRLKD